MGLQVLKTTEITDMSLEGAKKANTKRKKKIKFSI